MNSKKAFRFAILKGKSLYISYLGGKKTKWGIWGHFVWALVFTVMILVSSKFVR